MTRSSSGARRRPSASPFADAVPADVEQFNVGDRVTHEEFGLGTVVHTAGTTAVDAEFSSGRVRILAPFTKLTKL
jgi:hypothetical protein